MKNCKITLATLTVSIVAIVALLGCQKATEFAGEKVVDLVIDGVGNIKLKVDAQSYWSEINRQLPDDPNQPVIRWMRHCAMKEYLIFHNYYVEQSVSILARNNIKTCQNELKVLSLK